jgi:hypothetical protein
MSDSLKKDIVKKGEEIYSKLEPQLEKKHEGDFVAIDITSQDYFVGKSPINAINKAQRKHPKKIFFLAQVGKMASFLK